VPAPMTATAMGPLSSVTRRAPWWLNCFADSQMHLIGPKLTAMVGPFLVKVVILMLLAMLDIIIVYLVSNF
jgi:hypothetical protein